MNFSEVLKSEISNYHLLNHPFYQAWMKGELTKENLKHYTVQYFPHVNAFPRLVSAVHSHCEETGARKILLENLMEEEGVGFSKDHPTLWKDFGKGLGLSDSDFENQTYGPKSEELVSVFQKQCQSSFAEGLASLYAYEYQVPEIASSKIEGLKTQYQIQNPETVAFFSVHEQADKYHSKACAEMLDALPEQEQKKALESGVRAARALWDFLTEVHETQYAS